MTSSELALQIVEELRRRGQRVAVAESLTGGLLASALIDVPGASDVLLGGVVAYATPLKSQLLGVDASLLAERGPVDADVARQMAAGVRVRLAVHERAADYGLATTGVAGPGAQDGLPAGTAWVAIADAAGETARGYLIAGDRRAVREAVVDAALELLADALDIDSDDAE